MLPHARSRTGNALRSIMAVPLSCLIWKKRTFWSFRRSFLIKKVRIFLYENVLASPRAAAPPLLATGGALRACRKGAPPSGWVHVYLARGFPCTRPGGSRVPGPGVFSKLQFLLKTSNFPKRTHESPLGHSHRAISHRLLFGRKLAMSQL